MSTFYIFCFVLISCKTCVVFLSVFYNNFVTNFKTLMSFFKTLDIEFKTRSLFV